MPCPTYVRGRMIRVTRLDGCGNPIYGPDSVVTSKGITTIGYTANIDEGEEINEPNFAGERCAYDPARSSFLGYTVEITFCQVDPDLFAILTGQRTITDAFGNVVGFAVNSSVSSLDSAFSLEAWVGSVGGSACDIEGSTGSFGYILLPFLQGGVLGDFTLENAAVTFTVSGAVTKDANNWGVGPYNDVVTGADGEPSALWDPLQPNDHLYFIDTGQPPPEAQCGARPLLDPDAEPLTGVETAIADMTVTFTPTPSSVDPWWVDFGDEMWEYAEGSAPIEHEYENPGTYTYVAYRNESQIEGEVTVPGA